MINEIPVWLQTSTPLDIPIDRYRRISRISTKHIKGYGNTTVFILVNGRFEPDNVLTN